jgi:hypothetical protein
MLAGMGRRSLTLCCSVALMLLQCTAKPTDEYRAPSDPEEPPSVDEPTLLSAGTGSMADCFTPELEQSDFESGETCDVTAEDACVITPFGAGVKRLLAQTCHISCGLITVGLHRGCVTSVTAEVLGSEAKLECSRAALIGSLWDRAPGDGRVLADLGSCTVR